MRLKFITSMLISMAILIKVFVTSLPSYLSFWIYGNRQSWDIFTHTTVFERLLLYRLASQQPTGATLLEVGSYLGASTCFLAAGAKKVGGNALLHCVDTWQNDAMTEGPRDTWAEFHRNTQSYKELIISHRGRSEDIGTVFDKQIDLLFIDGDHSYEGCRKDLLTWLPYLKTRGIIIIHDYGWSNGVKRAVSELVQPRQLGKGHVLQNTYWARLI